MMVSCTLLLTMLMAADAENLVTPATELCVAYDDLRRHIASPHQEHTRYLTLYALPAESRADATAVVSFVLNSVSRTPRIVRPRPVPSTGGRLLRISLADYGLPADAWEALASREPYFHLTTTVLDPRTRRPRSVLTDGGWLDLTMAADLRQRTASSVALLRADYFLVRAASTARSGAYYQLAGVPATEAEFYKQLGLDVKTIGRLQADAGANLIRSGVTRKVRRVARRQGPLGGAWITYDVEQSTADRDPLRNPLGFNFDASEHIAAKSNGLHLFALYDRQGKRQDSVPDKIAKDASDTQGDGIIVPMLSCVRCHVEDGLRPVVNDQQRLLSGVADLFTEKPEDAQRLAAFYEANLEKLRRRDGDDYAEAVHAATDRAPVEIAALLGSLSAQYADALLTPAQAARELGVHLDQLTELFSTTDDPVLLAIVQGLSVQREQWEASFPQAALLTRIKP